MNINFNNKYAYAEIWAILEHLGEEYKRKVPKNLLKLFKDERKFGYRPEIDFNKPLSTQVRQETKNILAYLEYSCWLEDENKKAFLRATVNKNSEIRKAREKEEKAKKRANMSELGKLPLNTAIDRALKDIK